MEPMRNKYSYILMCCITMCAGCASQTFLSEYEAIELSNQKLKERVGIEEFKAFTQPPNLTGSGCNILISYTNPHADLGGGASVPVNACNKSTGSIIFIE